MFLSFLFFFNETSIRDNLHFENYVHWAGGERRKRQNEKKKKKFGLFQKRARETAPTPRLPDTAKMAAEG